MRDEQVVYFEGKAVLMVICALCTILSALLINFLLKSFDLVYLFALSVVVLAIVLLMYDILKSNKKMLSKIITTHDDVILVVNRKKKFILPKSDIKNFEVTFSSNIDSNGINYHTFININKISDNQILFFSNNFRAKGIIKSIFKISGCIPNFSYKTDNNSIPVMVEDIKKIAKCGKFLNFAEFMKFIIAGKKKD